MIFLDHIPENFLNWFTLRNYGFPTQWGGDEVMTFVEAAAVFFRTVHRHYPRCAGQRPQGLLKSPKWQARI
jgi:hypothetical protein